MARSFATWLYAALSMECRAVMLNGCVHVYVITEIIIPLNILAATEIAEFQVVKSPLLLT